MRPFPTIVDAGGNYFQSESLISEHQHHHSANYGRAFAIGITLHVVFVLVEIFCRNLVLLYHSNEIVVSTSHSPREYEPSPQPRIALLEQYQIVTMNQL